MRILLVNPNRYRTPPVPPLALEHLQSALRESRHQCRILDLCFEDNPLDALRREAASYDPHLAGLTIRNIDSVLYQNNIFFLDEIRTLVTCLRSLEIPVLLGGVGYSFVPEGILDYLGAQWGIKGPGEGALLKFLDLFESGRPPVGTILDGWKEGFDPDLAVHRGESVDYPRYIREGGIAGFETQKGCLQGCPYCPENRTGVIYRNPGKVVEELRSLADLGFTEFHLCDSEFNQDLEFCRSFLELLIQEGPQINWTLYMKSYPYDDQLFCLLKKSGVHLITLSIPTGKDSLQHAAQICQLAGKYGIKLAVDLLCGLPGETVDSVKETIEALRKIRPDTVGINSTIRLLPGLAVTESIINSPNHRNKLLGEVDNNPRMIRPVFYNQIPLEALRELIGGDPVFKIEGFERTSNYQRLGSA